MPASYPKLRAAFPKLTPQNYDDTSVFDPSYNCIGHAADTELWWDPRRVLGASYFWPPGVPRSMSFDAFRQAYEAIGYWGAPDETFIVGFEKVALFEKGGMCAHAAKQLDAVYWSSKLGRDIDIKHELRALEGATYGTVAKILTRPTRA